MGTRLRTNPGTIVYSVNTGQSSGPDRGRDEMIYRNVVATDGSLLPLDLVGNSLDAQAFGLSGGGAGVSAFDQAQEMDFNSMVDDAVANPTELTKEEYDSLLKEVGAIQRNELLSQQEQSNAISNLLTNAEIFHDPNTLNFRAGFDNGGLLSKRIKIIDPVDADGGAPAGGGQETSDLDDASSDSDDLLDGDVDTTVSADAGAASAESILSSSAETAGTNQSKEGVFSAADAIYQDYLQNPDKYVTGNVLERQLHEAALNETDPALKESLIAEFENYTGQPFDPSNPPMPIVKRVGMGLQRDADGNLVEGDYIGVYNAGSKTFTMADGRTIKWNGVSSVGDDGNMIVPQDGASYSLMGEYDEDGNLNTRRGGIEGVVAGPEANDGNQNANADGELTENGLITILNTQGLAGLLGVLITNDISLEDAKTTFPGLATAVDQLGNTNTGNSNIVSGGGNDTVITGGGGNDTVVTGGDGNLTDGSLTGGGNNGDGDGLTGDGDGNLTGDGNKGGGDITDGTNVTSGGTTVVTGLTPTPTPNPGGGITGTTIGPGSGDGFGNRGGSRDDLIVIMNQAPSVSEFFQSDIESIKLDPTSLYYRLFA